MIAPIDQKPKTFYNSSHKFRKYIHSHTGHTHSYTRTHTKVLRRALYGWPPTKGCFYTPSPLPYTQLYSQTLSLPLIYYSYPLVVAVVVLITFGTVWFYSSINFYQEFNPPSLYPLATFPHTMLLLDGNSEVMGEWYGVVWYGYIAVVYYPYTYTRNKPIVWVILQLNVYLLHSSVHFVKKWWDSLGVETEEYQCYDEHTNILYIRYSLPGFFWKKHSNCFSSI